MDNMIPPRDLKNGELITGNKYDWSKSILPRKIAVPVGEDGSFLQADPSTETGLTHNWDRNCCERFFIFYRKFVSFFFSVGVISNGHASLRRTYGTQCLALRLVPGFSA
jgi:hypothetical protein